MAMRANRWVPCAVFRLVMLLNVCLCFNSDVGYRKNVTNLNTCEYDPTSGVDPSGMPENCPEGSFYHRTKGQV